ncbi:DNA-directed RNA polymerase subunit D [Candidatus Woesearchaeota archaeon]|nr:DNA-directed RNA polymerase subunit D [Candidatus Woesearchaeota archaeon]
MAIHIEKISESKKENRLNVRVKGADDAFINTLRRLILEEVPTLAVEDIEIKDNNSALYDEMLALRIGLVPIKTDLANYSLPKSIEEVQERSARCTLQLKLKASKKGYVYAEEAESADPKCTFVYPKMPLVKLLAKQKVDLTLIAVMGQGKDHTKWSPGWAFYRNEASLNVGKVKDAAAVVAQSTDGVLTLKGNKIEVNEDKLYDSNLLEFYTELDPEITLEYTGNIILTVESWGQLSPKQMLVKSAEILIEKIDEMEGLI